MAGGAMQTRARIFAVAAHARFQNPALVPSRRGAHGVVAMSIRNELETRSPEAILARARAATGGDAWAGVCTLSMEGTQEAGGLSGPFDQRIDVKTGRSVQSFALGPARYASGYDGERGWSRSPNGEVAVQDSEAGRRLAVTQAWLGAHGGWFPARWPAHGETMGPRVANGAEHDVIRMRPEGGEAVELWFDRAAGLLRRVVQAIQGRDIVTSFDDYRPVDALLLPWRIAIGSGDARFDRVKTVGRVVLDEPIPAADFAPPTQQIDDLRFTAGGTGATVPVDVIQNTIVVPVTVDGHALRFILDTGGVNLLTSETVARLGLRSEGRLEAGGVGGQSVSVGFVRVDSLVIGGAVVLERQLLRELSIPGASDVLGVPVDGILGAEVLRRLVVRIDYAGQALTFTRPEECAAPMAGERLALRFFTHVPCVAATLDGEPGQFWLDTGNSGAVLLHAAEAGLAHRPTSAPTTIGWGAGGPVIGRLARARSLVLGGVEIAAPALRVLEDRARALVTPGLAGNIGGAILSRFDVTFDYSRQAVWLAPTAALAAPFHVDRSGLRIHANGGRFEVVAVMAGSPADEAGLRVADLVVAVDGVDARGIALPEQRRAWRESPVGTAVALRVERDGVAFDAGLVLRDLIAQA